MEAKHTPGPWVASGRIILRESEIGTARAVIGHALEVIGRDEQEVLANSRVMAAAPNLLQALAGLLAICEFGRFDTGVEHNGLSEGEMLAGARMDEARAALVKATAEARP